MFEILAVYFLCKANVKNARARGHNGGAFIALTITLWFLPEFTAIFLILVISPSTSTIKAVFIGFMFAVAGGVISFCIARFCRVKSFVPTMNRGTLTKTCGLSFSADDPDSAFSDGTAIHSPFGNTNPAPIPDRPIWEKAPAANYCRSCGSQISTQGKYCTQCGEEIK